MNEVAGISRTSHVNIVGFLRFCLEGSMRALNCVVNSIGKLYDIAIEIGQGCIEDTTLASFTLISSPIISYWS